MGSIFIFVLLFVLRRNFAARESDSMFFRRIASTFAISVSVAGLKSGSSLVGPSDGNEVSPPPP